MAKALSSATIVIACAVVAACDGNPLTTRPTDTDSAAFEDAVAEAETLLDQVNGFGDPTPFDPLPTGSATYQGVAGFVLAPLAEVNEEDFRADPGAYADYISDVALNVDFGSGVTGGSFSNFVDNDGSIDGSLEVSPVGLADFGGDLAFATTASGQIEGDTTNVDVEAIFVGSDAEGVLGRGEGDKDGTAISHYFVGVAD